MRSILVHADHDPANEGRLQAGLDIARRHGAHVTLMIATPFQQFIAVDPFGGSYLLGEAMAKAQADDAALDAALSARLAKEDVPWDVVLADGDVTGSLAAAATFADLAIVSLPGGGRGRRQEPSMLPGDLALAIRAPVLALPRDLAALDFEAPALVAWNGSPEAANALRSAIPLLAGRRVELVSVGKDDGSLPATDALAYLSRHGIHAEARIVDRGTLSVEEALERAALDMGAGLIVMGAFGKSQLRETLFGGVTQYLVTSGLVPLLLAH
ncbi:universal stress protein [Sphingopyxis sp. PET50]|uniref:universal stress protein n=1 Tax=Sphingopyxis sp. PET50 TaxID=2976533 RepID=UPI0021AE7467|nr:universal stress protein [Sphingopyxis sp. PET50]